LLDADGRGGIAQEYDDRNDFSWMIYFVLKAPLIACKSIYIEVEMVDFMV